MYFKSLQTNDDQIKENGDQWHQVHFTRNIPEVEHLRHLLTYGAVQSETTLYCSTSICPRSAAIIYDGGR